MSRFTIAQGYFQRDGERFVPMGVNYWPASCGVEMWQAWPEREISQDLSLVRRLRLNTVRFFLRWQDFEPAAGRYAGAMFRRLDQMLQWCAAEGIAAQPSLFVGWMSGGIFYPNWVTPGEMFRDRTLRQRAVAFAAQAAAVCSRHADTVLAVDQGNELCCLPDSARAMPAEVAAWCGEVSQAIRRAFPSAVIISGNDQGQICADNGWRLGAQPGCDCHSMHGYPYSGWHSVRFDGMTDPLAQSLLPFYLKCARAFGPVMLQEFGTLATADAPACSRYLRGMLPNAAAAGANGFLWWCLRDIGARGHPYQKNAFEGGMGLVDARGRIKSGAQAFLDFARGKPGRKPPAPAAWVYWPKEYYARDNPLNPGNEPRSSSRRMALAHFGLQSAGLQVGVARWDQLPTPRAGAVVYVAGAALTAGEAAALAEWVRGGGRLILSGVSATAWGTEQAQLIGADLGDFRRPAALGVKALGARWDFRHFLGDVCPGVVLRAAQVLASRRRVPLLLRHRLGKGCVVTSLPAAEDDFALLSDDPGVRSRWLRWYPAIVRATAR